MEYPVGFKPFCRRVGQFLLEDKKVYDAEDIQKFLGIGRSKTYTFSEEVYQKQEPFRVID